MSGYYGEFGSRAIVGRYFRRYQSERAGDWSDKVAWINSDANMQETETYQMLGSAPPMREWIGSRLAKKLGKFSFSITNKTYEQTLVVQLNDIRRDKTTQIMIRVGESARVAAMHRPKLITDLLEANGNAYDGKPFFSAAAAPHVIGDSGNIINELTATEVSALNVVSTTAPTQTEMANAILGVIDYMSNWKDDVGEPANEGATAFLVMVPTALRGKSMAAIRSALLEAGNTNPLFASLAENFSIEVLCNPRLTSAVQFYVFRVDSEIKAIVLQEEQPLEMSILAEGSDHAVKNDEYMYALRAVRNVGFGEFLYAARATIS